MNEILCISCDCLKPDRDFKDAYGRLPKIQRCRDCLDEKRKAAMEYHRGENLDKLKICTECKEDKPLHDYPRSKSSSGIYYPKTRCNACFSSHRKPKRIRYIDAEKARSQREKWERKHKPASHIVKASRASDARFSRENDMDVKFVESLIANGCAYCGDTSLRMTIDRIDNKVGHIRSNVHPACYQCNMIKRDMPYNAWIFLKDTIKQAKELGLFEDWLTIPFRGSRRKGIWEDQT